jgi:hypothetical protein
VDQAAQRSQVLNAAVQRVSEAVVLVMAKVCIADRHVDVASLL